MRSVIRYLTIYENREKVKKYICYLILAIIVTIPYIAPKSYDIISGLSKPETTSTIISYEGKDSVTDSDMTVIDAHITCTKYLYNYFKGYQLSKFVYRNNTLNLWVYNENGIINYNDIKEIGNLLKIRYPKNSIMIVLVYDNNSVYAIYDYRI